MNFQAILNGWFAILLVLAVAGAVLNALASRTEAIVTTPIAFTAVALACTGGFALGYSITARSSRSGTQR